jgi:tight adherence protein B
MIFGLSLPVILTIMAVLLLLFLAILFLGNKGDKQVGSALERIKSRDGAISTQNGLAPSGKAQSASNVKDIAKKLKSAEKRIKDQKNKTSLTSLIGQAGFETPLIRFWIYSLIFAGLCGGLILSLSLSPLIQTLLIFSCFFGLPRFYLKFKAKRRQTLFLQDFANALEDMIRLLKSGMPVTEAISMVAREYSGPIGEEMERVYNAQKLGETLPDAVQKMTLRVPLPEVQMFATAITIQVQTGSSLSEVLGNLSGVIRGRFALKRKIQALSSEARISAMIIGSIPIILTGVLYLVNRDYIMLLFTDPTGKMLTGIAVGMMLVGAAVMRQMINMKV